MGCRQGSPTHCTKESLLKKSKALQVILIVSQVWKLLVEEIHCVSVLLLALIQHEINTPKKQHSDCINLNSSHKNVSTKI